jgi:hypothetical protein
MRVDVADIFDAHPGQREQLMTDMLIELADDENRLPDQQVIAVDHASRQRIFDWQHSIIGGSGRDGVDQRRK